MDKLDLILNKVNKIETALVGDNFGNDGLIKRVKEAESKNDLMAKAILAIDTKRKISNVKLAAIIGTSVVGSGSAWEFIKYLASK